MDKINQIKAVFNEFNKDENMETHQALEKIHKIIDSKEETFEEEIEEEIEEGIESEESKATGRFF